MKTLIAVPGAALLILAATAAAAAVDANLDEVVVTSTALRSSVNDAIQPVAVISGAELQHDLSSSIGETLAKQAGVTGTYFGPEASRPIIRGLGGERVQVLEDGIGSLDVSSLSEDHAVSIEDLLAEQIEIVKGPASLLYGSGAVGGVVNVLTHRVPEKLPQGGFAGAAEVRGDTATQEHAVVGKVEMGLGSVALHADAYTHSSGDVAVPGYVWSESLRADVLAADPAAVLPLDHIPNTDSRADGGAVGASWIADRGFIGIGYSRFNTNYGTPLSPADYAAGTGSRIDMHQDRYDFKAELQGAADSWLQALRLRAARNDYEHAEVDFDGTIGTLFRQKGTEVRAALDHGGGDFRGTVGLQYRQIDFGAGGAGTPLVPDSLSRQMGVFAFEQYQMAPWTVEAGARVERQTIDVAPATGFSDYSGTVASGSLGALWKWRPDLSVAVNVTRSRRHPVAVELYANGAHDATGQFIVGDPNLGAETANTVDLVLRGSGALHWQLSAWMSRFQDFIYLAPTGAIQEDLPVFDYNQADARLHGFEAELTQAVLERGSSSLRIRLLGDYVRGQLLGGANLPKIPPWRIGGELDWDVARWHTGVSVYRYATQDQVSAYETPTTGYTDIDADVGLKQTLGTAQLSWFLKGSNLGDAEERRHTSPLKEYAPLPGRSLAAGVRVEF